MKQITPVSTNRLLTLKSLCYASLSFLLAGITTLPLGADVITFKDGHQVECVLRSQTRNEILYMANGRSHTAQKKMIKRIRYGQLKSEREKLEEKRKRLAALKREAERKAREAKAQAEKERLAEEARRHAEELKNEEAANEAELNRRRNMVDSLADELKEIAREEAALEDLRAELAARDKKLAQRKAEIEKLKAEMDRRAAGDVGGIAALWRSAIVPGWGQIYDRREWLGRTFIGSGIAGGLYWLSIKNERENARQDYITASRVASMMPRDTALSSLATLNYLQAGEAYIRMKASTKKANNFALVLFGIYLYNLFDAYTFKTGGTGDSGEKLNSRMEYPVSGGFYTAQTSDLKVEQRLHLSFRWNF